ncbi:hypothetical protein [Sinomonas sp. B1-1]
MAQEDLDRPPRTSPQPVCQEHRRLLGAHSLRDLCLQIEVPRRSHLRFEV